jgi:hypothetical protein
MRSHEMQVASRWNWIEAMNAMSVSGTKRTSDCGPVMSDFYPKADIAPFGHDVR